MSDLKNNDYVDFNTEASLGLTASTPLTSGAFGNTDELIAFTEQINKQFAVGGTNPQDQQAAMDQITQGMASGVFSGEELNSIFQVSPGIAQTLADYLGVSVDELRNMSAEGQIAAGVMKNAMFAAAEETNAKFESMPMTWSQVFTIASNVALQVLQPLLNGINWLANNISIIAPAVLGLGAAFAVFQVAAHWTQIAQAATAIYQGVVNFLSIGFGMLSGNTAVLGLSVTPTSLALPMGTRFSIGAFNYFVSAAGGDGNYEITCETAGEAGNEYGAAVLPIEFIIGNSSITFPMLSGSMGNFRELPRLSSRSLKTLGRRWRSFSTTSSSRPLAALDCPGGKSSWESSPREQRPWRKDGSKF